MVNSANSCSSNGIECNALSLLNTLLNKTGSYAERIRLQCELEEAGLDLNYLENVLKIKNLLPTPKLICYLLKLLTEDFDRKEYTEG